MPALEGLGLLQKEGMLCLLPPHHQSGTDNAQCVFVLDQMQPQSLTEHLL